jgi:hypothetical protein
MRVSHQIRFILILTPFITITSAAHATECLSSASAVWAAHPGSHATWRLRLPGHEGTKCWFASSSEGKGTHVGADKALPIPLVSGRGAIQEISDKAPPVPRHRSQDTLADTERAPLSFVEPASAGEAKSILMWGAPMRIDPMWEEIFERRERRSE